MVGPEQGNGRGLGGGFLEFRGGGFLYLVSCSIAKKTLYEIIPALQETMAIVRPGICYPLLWGPL